MTKKKGISYLWRAKSEAGQPFHIVAHDMDEAVKVASKFFTKQGDVIVEIKQLGVCYGDAGVFPADDEV